MTTTGQTSVRETPLVRPSVSERLANLPGARFLRNLQIGSKLTLGFGVLVLMTLILIGLSYLAGTRATEKINTTDEVRVPTALAAARAQTNLLRMQADLRGYLALGDEEYRTDYKTDSTSFATNLDELTGLASKLTPENQRRLNDLKATYVRWSTYPQRLFDLRDDQLAREPAYAIMATSGLRRGGTVLIDVGRLIDEQGRRPATAQVTSQDIVEQLADMARFQGSFSAMISGLRGYVTTRNRTFRGEYEANLALNQIAWNRLVSVSGDLTASQQGILDTIADNRAAFLQLPDQMFTILESDSWRTDLFLFRTEALPLSVSMLQLLDELTTNQQEQLRADLNQGKSELYDANRQLLAGGAIVLLLAIGMAVLFRENIAGPVQRLTRVAERVRGGDLEAQASVESSDEIGTLAETFNRMTGQLRQTLNQVRREKKRADDLLHVVVPIGVALASEKDFNILLEKMLVEAKTFCHADAGTLYLRTDDDKLEPMIVRNDTLNIAQGGTVTGDQTLTLNALPLHDADGEPNRSTITTYVAWQGESLNIPNAAEATDFDFSGPNAFREQTGYDSISFLTIPLKNPDEHVIGVMQLINAEDPVTHQIVPFDQNLQQMMESFSMLAVAALDAYIREQGLRQEIQQLRIEIDEVKRQQQVSEIVDSDFFQNLQSKARTMRRRSQRSGSDASADEESDS